MIIAVATTTALMVAVMLAIAWTRARGRLDAEVHHFRCPRCRRKLRYYARHMGHLVVCPQCQPDFSPWFGCV